MEQRSEMLKRMKLSSRAKAMEVLYLRICACMCTVCVYVCVLHSVYSQVFFCVCVHAYVCAGVCVCVHLCAMQTLFFGHEYSTSHSVFNHTICVIILCANFYMYNMCVDRYIQDTHCVYIQYLQYVHQCVYIRYGQYTAKYIHASLSCASNRFSLLCRLHL